MFARSRNLAVFKNNYFANNTKQNKTDNECIDSIAAIGKINL